MLQPNPHCRDRWRTMLKFRKMDRELPDLVQIVLNKESFVSTYGVDLYYLLTEEIYLNSAKNFHATQAKTS